MPYTIALPLSPTKGAERPQDTDAVDLDTSLMPDELK